MAGCRRVRAILAAAVYEKPEADEQGVLDIHLGKCPKCREQLAQWRQLAGSLPAGRDVLGRDLVPALRARLAESPPFNPLYRFYQVWAAPAFAGMAVVVLALAIYARTGGIWNGEALQMASLETAESAHGPVQDALKRADGLAAGHDHAGAMQVLQEAVARHPGDALAGYAQREIARLAFDQLKRYDLAFQEYTKLRNQFAGVFQEDPGSIDRLELLAEEWRNRFRALHAVDAVDNPVSDDPFRVLEEVMAGNPGKHVARLALARMEALLMREAEGVPAEVSLLESIRARCTNPIAIAQVNLHLGDKYCDELNDTQRARQLYLEAAQGGGPELAAMAGSALARLE